MYADVHILNFFVVVHFNFHTCLVYTHCSRAKQKKVGEGGRAGRLAPISCSHPFSGLSHLCAMLACFAEEIRIS